MLHLLRTAVDFVALAIFLVGVGRLPTAGGIDLGPQFRSSLAIAFCAALFAWSCRGTTRPTERHRLLDLVLPVVAIPAVGAVLKLGLEPTRSLALAVTGIAYAVALSHPVHLGVERILRERRTRLAGAAVAAAVILGFGLYRSGLLDARVTPLPAGSSPNLVLVTIDTTRTDVLGCYGSTRATSPALDRLAREGVRFEAAIANAPHTHSSIASILTSKYPAEHGSLRELYTLAKHHLTLAEHLRGLGYRTAAFFDNPWLTEELGFDQGYATFVEAAEEGPILAWLRREHGRPFFLHVHLLQPHGPYEANEPWASQFDPDYPAAGRFSNVVRIEVLWDNKDRADVELEPDELRRMEALYASEVRAMDEQIGRMLSELRDLGVEDDTLVVVVADHGEEFLDHGSLGHAHTLYDELIRVPLVLRFPRVLPPNTVVEEQIDLTDLAPTILGLMGLPPMPDARGVDRAPELRVGGELAATTALSQVYLNRGRHVFSVRTIRWKLIAHVTPLHHDRHHAWELDGSPASDFVWGNRLQLFDLEADPRETTDVAGKHPDVVRELTRELDRLHRVPAPNR